jgi:hypothetical protein
MKKAQEVQGLKKRLNASLVKPDSKKASVKENKTNPTKLTKKGDKHTTSVEVYLNVPSYKSPTRLDDSKSTSVLAEIGNNLKSPPLLGSQVETLT